MDGEQERGTYLLGELQERLLIQQLMLVHGLWIIMEKINSNY
jgi:hypothetical protein